MGRLSRFYVVYLECWCWPVAPAEDVSLGLSEKGLGGVSLVLAASTVYKKSRPPRRIPQAAGRSVSGRQAASTAMSAAVGQGGACMLIIAGSSVTAMGGGRFDPVR